MMELKFSHFHEVSVPVGYRPERACELYTVSHHDLIKRAKAWAEKENIKPLRKNEPRIGILGIDWQVDFCLEKGNLTLYPQTVSDVQRFVEFLYRNACCITDLYFTADYHAPLQIFSPLFWVDSEGNSPEPLTVISRESIVQGRWRISEYALRCLGERQLEEAYLCDYVIHYTSELEKNQRSPLVIWPLHCQALSAGQALVPSIYEAMMMVAIAREIEPQIYNKGASALSECYGPFCEEVLDDQNGNEIARFDQEFIQKLFELDALVVSGEAKSHCLQEGIMQILQYARKKRPEVISEIVVLNCTSSVPGFDSIGNEAFEYFRKAGIRIVEPEGLLPDLFSIR